ncbi:MAG: metal-dependent transcriptional regulator [Oscillospiraceae bacterium]|jgi:Mn-dependent DtxR family transcriptional regulator
MKIQESGENYLETILLLTQKNGSVRSIDVAAELDFSKPSVSRAIKILKEAGMIFVEKSGNIVLTETGRKRAEQVYERHNVITEFLNTVLDVDIKTAEKDACRIEHIISVDTFDKMKKYLSSL